MSWSTKRKEIVDTLNAIDGIKAYPMEPRASKPGDAWTVIESINRVDGFWEVTYGIYVMLSTDEVKAVEWLESNAEGLADKVQHPELPNLSAGYVDSIEPVNLAYGGATQYGVKLTIRSE